MTRTVIVLLILGGLTFSQARNKIFICRVYSNTGIIKVGYLRDVTDSTIVLAHIESLITDTIVYADINQIKVRGKRAALKGFLCGLSVGVAVGGAIGYLSYDEKNGGLFGAEGAGVVGAWIGGVTAGLVGFALGSSPVKFEIEGSRFTFSQAKEELKKYIFHR